MRKRMWTALLRLLLLWLPLLPPPLWGDPEDRGRAADPDPQRGPLQPYDLLYARGGVEAYYGGDFRDLEAALRSHQRLWEVLASCSAHRPLAPPSGGGINLAGPGPSCQRSERCWSGRAACAAAKASASADPRPRTAWAKT